MPGVRIAAAVIILLIFPCALALGEEKAPDYLQALSLPARSEDQVPKSPILIAVVDDGFRLTHKDISDFIYRNLNEIPGNGFDDDGNGYIDDFQGWDVSDGDSDPSAPIDRLNEFYHGTYLAGVIADIAKAAFGSNAHEWIRILPVKAVPNEAEQLLLWDGYDGIEYAVAAGADLVLTAWGRTEISQEEQSILETAARNGTTVIASAGNIPDGRKQYPAAAESVIAVAALDQGEKKLPESNFGDFVDLCAPGQEIPGSHPATDDSRFNLSGTSPAAAITSVIWALCRSLRDDLEPVKITAALVDTARPVDLNNTEYSGLLGAGIPAVSPAVEKSLFDNPPAASSTIRRSSGYFHWTADSLGQKEWIIDAPGTIEGVEFRLRSNSGNPGHSRITFSSADGLSSKTIMVSELSDYLAFPGSSIRVLLTPDPESEDWEWLVAFRAKALDVSKKHCHGTMPVVSPSTITDGSGSDPYAPGSDCKWLFTAPEGKVLRFRFKHFDTENYTDKLYFFDGSGTHEPIMAVFSGSTIPPDLLSWSSTTLMWFVTDGKNQRQGWEVDVDFVDPEL